MTANPSNKFDWVVAHWEWLFALLCLPVALALFQDFGLTWDASSHMDYGQRILNYFQTGFSYQASFDRGNIPDKGPGFALPVAVIHWILGLGPYSLWNLIISLFAILTLPPLIKLGKLFGNQRVALFSVFALLLMPRFVGHAFTNPIDIPLACAVCWSMFAILRLYNNRGFGKGNLVVCGLTIGFALSIRPGGMFLFFYLTMIGLFQVLQTGACGDCQTVLKRIWHLGVRIAMVLVLAWIVMISFWPYAHQNPILNPIGAVQTAKNFNLAYPVLFNGKYFLSDNLPWYYMLWFLAISTPLNLLFLIAAGFCGGIVEQVRSWRSSRSLLIFGLELWTVFPISYFIVFTPNIYDGIRHVLFIFPGLALVAGLGADYLFQWMRKYIRKTLAAAVTVTVLVSGIVSVFTMNPYQMCYFNTLAGNPDTLHTRYETDYWLSSYKEGAEWINQRQKETKRPLRVLIAANALSWPCAVRYLDHRIRPRLLFGRTKDTRLPDDIDYYLSTTRYGLYYNFPEEKVVHAIKRNGILLSVVKGHSCVFEDAVD